MTNYLRRLWRSFIARLFPNTAPRSCGCRDGNYSEMRFYLLPNRMGFFMCDKCLHRLTPKEGVELMRKIDPGIVNADSFSELDKLCGIRFV